MKKILKLTVAALTVASLFVACNDEDITEDVNNPAAPSRSTLTLNIDNLGTLGNNFTYEGWIIVDGNPVSAGRFTKTTFPQTFRVDSEMLSKATSYDITIEPEEESEENLLKPEATKIMSGNFNANEAVINSDNSLISSESSIRKFGDSWGKYILATPTDGGADTNEESGIWFLDNSSGSEEVGLGLPALTEGWQYEGWIVIDGVAVSTGTFTKLDASDNNAMSSIFRGEVNVGPAYPGEDFLRGSVGDINFPVDLKGKEVVISVEPNPDDSVNPFILKPLVHKIPENANVHSVINMAKGPVPQLTGRVTRE